MNSPLAKFSTLTWNSLIENTEPPGERENDLNLLDAIDDDPMLIDKCEDKLVLEERGLLCILLDLHSIVSLVRWTFPAHSTSSSLLPRRRMLRGCTWMPLRMLGFTKNIEITITIVMRLGRTWSWLPTCSHLQLCSSCRLKWIYPSTLMLSCSTRMPPRMLAWPRTFKRSMRMGRVPWSRA